MIIADFGSGNTCKNDYNIIQNMIDEFVKAIGGTRDDVVIKWQLFQEAGANQPLNWRMFDYAYSYAHSYGYKTTASVFDPDSVKFLLRYPIPFVKYANNVKLPTSLVPENVTLIRSGHDMACISEYPATMEQ